MRGFLGTCIVLGALVVGGSARAGTPPLFVLKWGSPGGGNGQFSQIKHVAADPAGNLYVADHGNNRIQKFSPSGAYITQWGTPGGGNGQFNGPFGIGTDAAGNVYVAERFNNRVQKFTGSGGYITQWGSTGTGNGQFNAPIRVAIDGAGNVYVTENAGNRVQKFTSTGGYITQWSVPVPTGVAVDGSGNVYVAQQNGARVQKFDGNGSLLTQWGSPGTGNGQFSIPEDVAVDAEGSVYVADWNNQRIQKFTSTGVYVTQWGSAGSGDGQFNQPFGLCVDPPGNVYVADGNNNRIQKFGPLYAPPAFLTKWGTSGSGNGEFLFPQDAATDAAGNVYVADAVNNRIQKFTNTGAYITQWGSFGSGNGQFRNPYGVAVGPGGVVYVADASNTRIQKFTATGVYLTKWGTAGTGNGQFNNPLDVTTDAAGNVYVSDYSNNNVQKFDGNGAFLLRWGTTGAGNGQFSGAWGLAIDAFGNVYVSDFDNNRVQKFSSTGAYLAQWGSFGTGDGQLFGPEGLAIDAAGSVYVADYRNYRVQRFTSTGTFMTGWNSGDGTFDFIPSVATDAAGNVFVVDYAHRIQKFGPLGITALQPNRGGNGGAVTVVVLGAGFESGATVKLTRSGQPDIPGSNVSVAASGNSLSARFDLTGAAAGSWDATVTNPSSSMPTLANAFTIESSAPHQLRVDIVGRSSMRPDRRRAFDVVIQNLGNNDALDVPLWIARIPTAATVELDFPLTSPPVGGGEPDWSLAPLTLGGPGGKYVPLVIPRLPPGVTTRRIYLTVPGSVTSLRLDAALTPPWANDEAFLGCLSGAGLFTDAYCVGSQLALIRTYLANAPGVQALSGIGLWAKIAWLCEGAATLPAALAEAEQVLDYMLQPVEGAAVPAACAAVLKPRWQDSLGVQVVTSIDPNEKLGAGGVGPSRLIGSEQLLPYSVQFENLPSASAPAQDVVVIDQIDASKYDLNTVSLGAIKFGRRASGLPWTVEPPPGLSTYTTTVDLRPERNLLVRVGFSLDRATGSTAWSMASLDPATGETPDDPLAGFLPPNAVPPEGEGSVALTVLPKPALANGTVLSNQASIVFDGAPLGTAPWTNTIDTGAPLSQVLPLPATQDSARFTVRWALDASYPDFRDYSVYVSEAGGPYRPWRLHVTSTADTFDSQGGDKTYAFYSLARDVNGNLEAVPGTPDAETYRSMVSVVGGPALELALEGAVPNPAVGEARVWFTLPSLEPATMEVMDVAGRRVWRREVSALGPGRHSLALGGATRRPGLYFVSLAQGGRTLHARMVVVR